MAQRILTPALAAGTAIGIVAFAHAQGGKSGTSGPGASDYAPGRSNTNQPPGQGGTPPGQMMNDQKNRSR